MIMLMAWLRSCPKVAQVLGTGFKQFRDFNLSFYFARVGGPTILPWEN